MSNTGQNAFPRISARRGQIVDLNVDFLRNGVLTDPYAIRYVELYKTAIAPHNLVATIPIVGLSEDDYPSPLYQEESLTGTGVVAGSYHLLYSIPQDFLAPDVYFDLWYYFADDPCGDLGTESNLTECNIDDDNYADLLLKSCHRFWVYPDEWFSSDGLQTVRFGFEPLDQRFYQPELRPLEIGLMPLPLYDYNFNLVNPLIPFLTPTISIETQHCELLVNNAPARIGIRQGSYRSNPWVVQYDLDTSDFLKGTYRYWLKLSLPDGSTRVSRKFILTIS